MAVNDDGIDIKRSSQVEEITPEQVESYVRDKKCDRPCPACGETAWIFPHYNGRPELLMMPSARDPRTADWFFQMCCNNCGVPRIIGASFVWAHIYGQKADEA